MSISENELRDYLFENHKTSISSLICGRREPIEWDANKFPPISVLLQQIVERKINHLIDGLATLKLSAKELRLEKTGDSTTRVDLFGILECGAITIIELKKSNQTERQSFTELLAYANHFCSIFPGLTENAINTVLIAPMETRTVKDAYVQEILGNNKSSLALILSTSNDKIELKVYYPDRSYYQSFENVLLDDSSLYTISIAFQNVEGWIDTDIGNKQKILDHSKSALNTISSSISHRLEVERVHSFIYASQLWGEIPFDYPNIIYVIYINPFALFRNISYKNEFCEEKNEIRSSEIQSIYEQLCEEDRIFWIELMDLNFQDFVAKLVKEEFNKCFINTQGIIIDCEISTPDWHGIRTGIINTVFTHNLDTFQTGLIQKIYTSYIAHIFKKEIDSIFYSDDLPRFSYQTLRCCVSLWEILRGLGKL